MILNIQELQKIPEHLNNKPNKHYKPNKHNNPKQQPIINSDS